MQRIKNQKKISDKEPMDRQKELHKYMSANIGISREQAMKDLKYSKTYARSVITSRSQSYCTLTPFMI